MTHIPNHIDYIEFPAPDATAHAASKAFYRQVFGWQYQNWGSDYSDTQGSGVGSGIDSKGRSLAALTLLVAESDPKQKDVLIRLVMHILNKSA